MLQRVFFVEQKPALSRSPWQTLGGFMRKFVFTSMLVAFFVAAAAQAQLRGTGRLMGNIFDKNTGKPVVGATVTISLPGGRTQPIIAKTDWRGHWAAIGMTEGQWEIDISPPGYVTTRGTAHISELTNTPAIKTQLEPEAKQEAAPEVPVAPSIPKEAVDAINEGQALLKAKAGDTATDAQGVSHTVTA